MEAINCRSCRRVVCFFLLYLAIVASCFTCSDAGRSEHLLRGQNQSKSTFKLTKHFDLASLLLQRETMTPSNTNPYVSSPFTLPPYDSLPPTPLPPYCIYPPNTPQPPSTSIPTPLPPTSYGPPILPTLSPPPSPAGVIPSPPESIPTPNPPTIVPTPPETVPSPTTYIPSPPAGPTLGPPSYVPSPPSYVPSPPSFVPSPTGFVPSPPSYVPSPTGFVPSPTIFLPPIVYPPPVVPPSPKINPPQALWCVAKPSVPDPIIQEAMNYACGSGADCDSIQPSGPCFQPNTLFAHASYAFNSYWQRTKVAGGTCSFGGTAILVTVDPSFDGCHFIYA